MNKTNWFRMTAAAVLSAGLLTTFQSTAADRPALRGNRAELAQKAREKLGLSDEQIARIKEVLAADKDTLKDLITRMHDARVTLREAIHAKDATESSVRAAAEKVGAVQSDLAVERFKLHHKISPILTEEQRAKIKQFQGQIDDFLENAVNRLGERLSGQ
jgi:Spy/CpxP family protein refolding chaperone